MEALKVYKTHSLVTLPKKQTAQSACFDISFQGHGKGEYKGYTRMNKAFTRPMNNMVLVQPGDRVMVPTGLILDIPKGYSVRVHARSGLSLKQGLVLANAEGVIDSDYVEELMVLVHNISDNPISIHSGDRIAQGELVKDVEYEITESVVRPIVKTERVGGMGSTGVTTEGNTIIFKTEIEEAVIAPPEPVKRGRGRPRKNA
jgi:dUTP pyrophosphatase